MEYEKLIGFLKSEIKPALGCTEPAAVALAVARAIKFLGSEIKKIEVTVSGNILKNAMAVTIPNTRENGLLMASALGMLIGDPEKELQIFDDVGPETVEKAHQLIAQGRVSINLAPENGIYIEAKVLGQKGWAQVYVIGGHTNMVKAIVNGEILFRQEYPNNSAKTSETINIKDYTFSSLIDVIETLPIKEIDFLQDGIDMNLFMAKKGLELNPGLGVGAGLKLLLEKGILSSDIVNKARMVVAAACDARMAGVNFPVVSTMGSGNHGLEAILPVAVVAEKLQTPKEKVLRALALSHLVTALVKQHTGKLSPICGCSVAAGAGAAAAITWIMDGNKEQIEGAVQNIIGSLAGMICDGAKGGCALKLSTAAGEAVIAAKLALQGIIISSQDGIIAIRTEDTIRNLGRISNIGMARTEEEILKIILDKEKKSG